MSAIFLLPVCLIYWPKSVTHASTPTWIIPTKFEVDMTIHCRVIAFLSADTSRDLVTVTFDLLTLNICITWRVTCPTLPTSLKTLRSSVLEFGFIAFPVAWLPLRMRTRPLRMHRITFPVSRGSKIITFLWNHRPRFAYLLYNFPWATTTIKVRVLSSVLIA